MLVHTLNPICFLVSFSLLKLFFILWLFYIMGKVPVGGYLGLGTLGSSPREILEVFLECSAATSFCCICLMVWKWVIKREDLAGCCLGASLFSLLMEDPCGRSCISYYLYGGFNLLIRYIKNNSNTWLFLLILSTPQFFFKLSSNLFSLSSYSSSFCAASEVDLTLFNATCAWVLWQLILLIIAITNKSCW